MSLAEALVAVETHRDLLRGEKGPKGEAGPAGRDGERGETGPVGRVGKSITGPVGAAGRNGRDGVDGAPGPRGDTGPAGKIGPPGKDGVGPDEKVRVSKDDPKAGFLADKLTAGNGIDIRTTSGKGGERLVIDARPQLGGGGSGGPTGVVVYQDGVGVAFGDKVSFDGGDPVTISGGVIRVPVGSGVGAVDSVNGQTGVVVLGAADVGALASPFTADVFAESFTIFDAVLEDATLTDATLSTDLNANNHKITGVANPASAGDAVNKGYLDDNFLTPAAGDAAYQPLDSDLTAYAGSTPETYTESNVVTDRGFDAASLTLNEMAHVLGSLIVDLRARGVVA